MISIEVTVHGIKLPLTQKARGPLGDSRGHGDPALLPAGGVGPPPGALAGGSPQCTAFAVLGHSGLEHSRALFHFLGRKTDLVPGGKKARAVPDTLPLAAPLGHPQAPEGAQMGGRAEACAATVSALPPYEAFPNWCVGTFLLALRFKIYLYGEDRCLHPSCAGHCLEAQNCSEGSRFI